MTIKKPLALALALPLLPASTQGQDPPPPIIDMHSMLKGGRLAVLAEVANQYSGIAPDDERMEPYWTRAIEDRLMRDTWQVPGYDLIPELRSLRIPTLVLVGDHDFIPVRVGERIVQALPDAAGHGRELRAFRLPGMPV